MPAKGVAEFFFIPLFPGAVCIQEECAPVPPFFYSTRPVFLYDREFLVLSSISPFLPFPRVAVFFLLFPFCFFVASNKRGRAAARLWAYAVICLLYP
ncbi:hypothetical protein BS50DRAFT_279100 [Corynespora cassiicola Philippines]|uniref:Uncharacterized protein n=1 Tax=Corynespora cassiicola Philippines TaxID=1448308 RepID=A0A2T2P0T1_CORCC|nr:hypothetical protein BS50DRAFT_279100 [Corynespora cassiicola Philippines]